MFLIVGASSSVGRAAIPMLREAGYPLRLTSRDPSKLASFAGPHVETMYADLTDRISLSKASKGIEKVLLMAHSLLGRGRYATRQVDESGVCDLIDIAREHKVSHFVMISILGASPNASSAFFRAKARAEACLMQSGLSYTILRPSAFFLPHTVLHPQAFFNPERALKEFMAGDKATFFGKGENPRNFVANEDVARFAVIALTDPSAVNQVIEIGGPQNLTAKQVAGIYSRVTGHEHRINSTPLMIPRLMHLLMKPFHPGLSDAMRLAIDADTKPETFDGMPGSIRYHVPLTPLEDWIRDRMGVVRT